MAGGIVKNAKNQFFTYKFTIVFNLRVQFGVLVLLSRIAHKPLSPDFRMGVFFVILQITPRFVQPDNRFH